MPRLGGSRRQRLDRAPRPGVRRRASARYVFFACIFLLLCALRWPLADRPIRDVDESVSAIIATEWLHGGVPYRDAIDQRGPVTYLLYAATFLVAGENNMLAVHWLLLLLIFAACALLFRFGGELGGELLGSGEHDDSSGYLAALLVAIASYTYRRSQMLAFHTEWPVLVLSSLGALLVWRAVSTGRLGWRLPLAGAAFGASFLSKQPAVFDGIAAGLFLLAWQAREGRFLSLETLRRATGLAAGFVAVVVSCVLYFAAHGALGDFYLYFWSYNVDHYTAVVPMAERIGGLDPFAHRRHYLTANPLLLVAAAVTLLRVIVDWLRRGRQSVNGRLLLGLWFAGAYFGASFSGRNFGHYFIQIIAPSCLMAALLVREIWLEAPAWRRSLRVPPLLVRGLLVVAVAVGLAQPLARFSRDIALFNLGKPPRPKVAQEALIDFVARATRPDERVFVWGYNPEIYVLSGRRPATRYSNTNYLTGMLPWENHRPGIDTSEHIVAGAWDILFEELDATPPILVIDTSVGDHRYYGKYPLSKFPRLERYLQGHYEREEVILDERERPYYVVYRRRAP
jgi:hypothetical protein